MPARKKTDKLSVSLPSEIAVWLRAEAARDMDDLSGVIRKHLLPAMRRSQGSIHVITSKDWEFARSRLAAAQTLLNAVSISAIAGKPVPSQNQRIALSEEAEDLIHDCADVLDRIPADMNRVVHAIKEGDRLAQKMAETVKP